jgi:uncharacterized protein
LATYDVRPEQRTATIAVDDVRTEGKTLRGFAALYNAESRDLGGFTEVIQRGAFTEALSGTPDVLLTFNHSPDRILARTASGTLRLSDEERGLAFEAELGDGPTAQDVRDMVKRGDLSGASFRFTIAAGGERWEGDKRTLTRISELIDVSLATTPAYDGPKVELRTRSNDDGAEERQWEKETSQGGKTGGLRVEDRNDKPAGSRDVDRAIRDAIRDVKPGEARALTTAVSVSPGELSTTLFDKLRSQSVVLSSGAVRVLTTDSDSVTYPTITVDTAPTNYAEAATITPGDPTLATVVAVPQKIAHLVQLSNEVIDDSDPSVVQVVTDNLLRATAVKLDQQLIEGSGTPPQMTGMHLTAGVQTMASAAIMANFDWASDALALLEGVGGTPAAWFMASRTYAQVRKLKKGAGDVTPVMGAERGGPSQASPMTLFGVPMYHSNQVSITDSPGTATAVHLVAEGALVYVNRQSPVVEVDRSRLFNSDQSEIRVKTRGNLIAAIPNGIVRVTGLLPG